MNASFGVGEGPHKGLLQLLCNCSGAFRPGILTALVGVSGDMHAVVRFIDSALRMSESREAELRLINPTWLDHSDFFPLRCWQDNPHRTAWPGARQAHLLPLL